MNSLITITEKEVGAGYEQCVNGRDLYEFLGVDTRFNDWIKRRIEEYGFQQGVDYEVFLENEKNPQGGRPHMEYSFTVEMAKELSMLEKNEKGRIARKYFLEIERRYKDIYREQVKSEPGVLQGIKLSRVLQRNGFDLADAARLVWYRKAELTQVEAAKLFDMPREKIQEIERTLKEVGVEFPAIKANRRAKRMRNLLDKMLGFNRPSLQLVHGGAL